MEEAKGLQHSQHAEGVLLDVQSPQHRVQVGQIFGQQLPALVDQLTQLSHLTWEGNGMLDGKNKTKS